MSWKTFEGFPKCVTYIVYITPHLRFLCMVGFLWHWWKRAAWGCCHSTGQKAVFASWPTIASGNHWCCWHAILPENPRQFVSCPCLPHPAWEKTLLQPANTPHQPSASSPELQLGQKFHLSNYYYAKRALAHLSMESLSNLHTPIIY